MIGLDTKILVRYLTQDDPIQSPKATEIIERRLTETKPGFVSVVAMVETVWVLDRAYGLASQDIAAAIERMLQVGVLVIEKEQKVFAAMDCAQTGPRLVRRRSDRRAWRQRWLRPYPDI